MGWTKEDAKTIRELIKQESDVSNHRLTWMVTLEGFLFASLSFAWNEGVALSAVLAFLGVFSSVSSLIALYVAHEATVKIIASWERNRPQDYDGPDVIGYFVKGRLRTFAMPWFLLPFLLILTWVVILYINFFARQPTA